MSKKPDPARRMRTSCPSVEHPPVFSPLLVHRAGLMSGTVDASARQRPRYGEVFVDGVPVDAPRTIEGHADGKGRVAGIVSRRRRESRRALQVPRRVSTQRGPATPRATAR